METAYLDFINFLLDFALRNGYAGAFLISVLANATIFFPIPYAIAVYMLGAILEPPVLGFVAGLGAAIGEISAYTLGFVGRKVIDAKYGNKLRYATKLLGGYGALGVFLFSAFPLIPVDIIMITVGILRYNVFKALVACFFGKMVMCILLAYAGRYSLEFVRAFFEVSGVWGVAIAIILLSLIVIVLLRIDWLSVFEIVKKRGWRGLIRGEHQRG